MQKIKKPKLISTLFLIFFYFWFVPHTNAFQQDIILVTNNLDSGEGSLREAIVTANNTAGVIPEDPIRILIQSTESISLLTPLPILNNHIKIEGPMEKVLIERDLEMDEFRIFYVGNEIHVSLFNLIISNGASSYGGAILSEGHLTIHNCEINENSSSGGGAIGMEEGSLKILNSRVLNNTSFEEGGALLVNGGALDIQNSWFESNSATGNGGAIYFAGNSLKINSSTFSDNYTSNSGGALFIATLVNVEESAIINSTFYGNLAENEGGAMYVPIEDFIITSTTIANNKTTNSNTAAGIYIDSEINLPISNSIIIGNFAGEFGSDINGVGFLYGMGYNLIGIIGNNIIDNAEANLYNYMTPYIYEDAFGENILKFNGGLTPTLAITENSLARNAGDPENPFKIITDQRGYIRSGQMDIGSFELDASEPFVINSFPYRENFEETSGGWYAQNGATPGWEYGIPQGRVIGVNSEGSKSWVTNLTGNYVASQFFYLYSPVFDFSQFEQDPHISFKFHLDIPEVQDGAYLEYSSDAGKTWIKLERTQAATSWYNNFNIDGEVWNGTFFTWNTASNILNNTAGKSDVRLRFVLSSNLRFSQNPGEGIGIDNIEIMIPFFSDSGIELPQVYYSTISWADVNNDNKLDLLIGGYDGQQSNTLLYIQGKDNTFTPVIENNEFPQDSELKVEWADFNNDGFVDALISSHTGIYLLKNNGDNTFTKILNLINQYYSPQIKWGDFNNDGFQDFVVSGSESGEEYTTDIYFNNRKETFDLLLSIDFGGSVAVGDFDNDGFQDLFISGYDSSYNLKTNLLRNNRDNTFIEIPSEETGIPDNLYISKAEWTNINNDEFLDIVLVGSIYHQEKYLKTYLGSATGILTEYPNLSSSFAPNEDFTIGDINNDGKNDLILIGNDGSTDWTALYISNGDNYDYYNPGIESGLPRVEYGSIKLGDYNNDGILDLAFSGYNRNENKGITKIYHSPIENPAQVPTVPGSPNYIVEDFHVSFFWENSTSTDQPGGLSYNFFIKDSDSLYVSPLSNLEESFLKVPNKGNTDLRANIVLDKTLFQENKIYSWGVQAVNNGYKAGGWAQEVFVIQPIAPTINWIKPEPLIYGTAITNSILNAEAFFENEPVAGNYNYYIDESFTLEAEDTILGAGTHIIYVTFTPENTKIFSEVSSQVSIEIEKADQLINFEEIIASKLSDSPIALMADASSGLPVSFILEEGSGYIEEDLLILEGAGIFTVKATQEGNENFNPAPEVVKSFEILREDKTILIKLFEELNGEEWLEPWNFDEPIEQWHGITANDGIVTKIILPGNNLRGKVPQVLSMLIDLEEIDFSNNKLEGEIPVDILKLEKLKSLSLNENEIRIIPDLKSLENLILLDVANNYLEFKSIEDNLGITSFIYSPQKEFGEEIEEKIQSGKDHTIDMRISGSANNYTWFKDGQILTEEPTGIFQINSIDREKMGKYRCEVSNDLIPDLTISSKIQNILAVGNISGQVKLSNDIALDEGEVILFSITTTGKFDTTAITQVTDGSFNFENVVLNDYILIAIPNPEKYPKKIATYYEEVIFWDKADTIFLNNNVDDIIIHVVSLPDEPLIGEFEILGYFEEEINSEGRIFERKRIGGAGVSASRAENVNRGKDQVVYVVVAFTYTNQDGEFEFKNLPTGKYRLNIQYPGIPMDEDSFVDFDLEGDATSLKVSATLESTGIVVRKLEETGRKKGPFATNSFTIYPNPARDHINIIPEFNIQGIHHVILSDLRGRQLLKKEIRFENGHKESFSIENNNLSKGIYIIRISNDLEQQSHIERIIIKK
jgi:hypothetical protein